MFELHVWGPAFGLPSIDAECIAAIAYLSHEVREGEWRLIADHDPSLNPNNAFPAVHDDGVWITGFQAIVKHLRDHSAGLTDLDSSLSPSQQADITAFSTFLQTHAVPLLDLSLYTSYANYTGTTRPAYTKILPWHANYHVPPSRRALARARTAHFGLSGLDLDSYDDEPLDVGAGTVSGSYEAAKKAAGLPSDNKTSRPGLFSKQKGIKNLLSQPQYTSRFRLDALTNEVLTPLDELLGEKEYLVTDGAPTSLDCLALGILSLMLYAPVLQAWISEAIKSRYPKLDRYTQRLRDSLLGGTITPEDALSPTQKLVLPWHAAAPSTPAKTLANILHQIGRHIPVLSYSLNRPVIRSDTPHAAPLSTPIFSVLSTAALALVAGLTYHQYHTQYNPSARLPGEDLVFEAPRKQPHQPPLLNQSDLLGLDGIGDAQDVLAALGRQMHVERTAWEEREAEREAAVQREVEVERDRMRVGSLEVRGAKVEVEVAEEREE